MKIKGQTLLGKLFNMLLLLAIGCAMIIVIYGITKFAGDSHRYDVTVKIMYNPTKYDIALMSFLETTDPQSGVPVKDILAAAVSQESNGYVYAGGSHINVRSVTEPLLATILEKPFFLRSTAPELKLGGNPANLGKNVYKTSTQLFKPDGTMCNLELYVG